MRTGANPLSQRISGDLSTAQSDVDAYRNAVTERERQLDEIDRQLQIYQSHAGHLSRLDNLGMMRPGSGGSPLPYMLVPRAGENDA